MIWQVASATGWSVDYILWGVNYETLQRMLADAPRYIKLKDKRAQRRGGAEGKAATGAEILNYFQTRLKK